MEVARQQTESSYPASPIAHEGGFRLLVDSDEVFAAVESAVLSARRRVLIQAMTFELDGAGRRIWELLAHSPATERILCVDAFSTVKVSDHAVFGPRYLTDREFRQEAQRTRQLLRSGQRDGVRVIVTNPMGFLCRKYLQRNHKKMLIADGVAFLGGVNFSDHNFAWQDMMTRTGDPCLVEALAHDFYLTAASVNQSNTLECGSARVYFLDGYNSRSAYEVLFQEILGARKSITIMSPYLSNPLLSRLRQVAGRVKVRVISPARNNKPLARHALTRAAAASEMELLLYQPNMSHLKAALIDDERLIFGSYNFDIVGYELQQEVVISTSDRGLIDDFRRRILASAREESRPPAGPRLGWLNWPGWAMGAAEMYVKTLRRAAYR